MIIDAHMHIWNKLHGAIGRDTPLVAAGNGMVRIGDQTMLGMPAYMHDCRALAEEFVAEMDAAGVDLGVVVQENMDGEQNDYCLDAMARFPGRIFAHGLPNYWKLDTVEMEAKALFARGFRGLKLPAGHFTGKIKLDDAKLLPIYRHMEKQDNVLAVDLSVGQGQVAEMNHILAECPTLRVAVGHFGMVNRDGWPGQLNLCKHPNVYMETGGIIWLYRHEGVPFPGAVDAIRRAADAVGINKLMWGSDWPRTMVDFTYRQSIQFLRETNRLSDAEKTMLLGGSAASLYGIKETGKSRKEAALITEG